MAETHTEHSTDIAGNWSVWRANMSWVVRSIDQASEEDEMKGKERNRPKMKKDSKRKPVTVPAVSWLRKHY